MATKVAQLFNSTKLWGRKYHFNLMMSLHLVVGFLDLKSCLMAFLRPVGSKRPEVERGG